MKESELISAIKAALFDASQDRKIYVLLVLAHKLTISMRWAYSERDNEDETVEKMYALNEVQHSIINQLLHLTAKDNYVQAGDTFIDSLYTFAQTRRCKVEVSMALESTLRVISH